MSLRLFGGHVGGRAKECAVTRQRRKRRAVGRDRVNPLRKTEVEDLDRVASRRPRDHDVGGLQVAMNDARRVGRRQRIRDLRGVVERA